VITPTIEFSGIVSIFLTNKLCVIQGNAVQPNAIKVLELYKLVSADRQTVRVPVLAGVLGMNRPNTGRFLGKGPAASVIPLAFGPFTLGTSTSTWTFLPWSRTHTVPRLSVNQASIPFVHGTRVRHIAIAHPIL